MNINSKVKLMTVCSECSQSVSQTKKLQLIQLVWALQEFSARNCELVSLCHRPRNCNLSNLCGRCKSLAPEIVSWFLDSASRNLLRLRRNARCARLSPPADSRAFGARARASRSIFLAPPALVFGSIAQNRVFDKDQNVLILNFTCFVTFLLFVFCSFLMFHFIYFILY